MMKAFVSTALATILLSAAGFGGTGCGKDECEEATDALEDCGVKGEKGSGKCEGDAEKQAKCVNDNKGAACDYFKALESGTVPENNAFGACLGQ
jgi:hypothetical protein